VGRSSTESFVLELPLKANSWQTKVALARFEAGRQLYNACLGEALKRRDQMLRSKIYRQALAMPHKTEEETEARAEAFAAAREKYGFTEYSLHGYATGLRNSWLGKHIDANTAQTLATRAYRAVDKTLTGEAKKVRFKRYGQLGSLEGKTNKQGIRWKDGRLVWNGLELSAIIDEEDPVVAHGLSCPVKYVRLVKKTIRSRVRLYAQLVLEGRPYQKEKNRPLEGKVGLDLGPSTIAEVSDTEANLGLFCPELDDIQAKIRILQRRMDRQRRANNPQNYNPDGTVKKGKLKWQNSKRYLKTRARLRELHRSAAEHRKSLHGRLVNGLLRRGNEFYLEDISYKALQKAFGASVEHRAPGMFIAKLKRKALVVEFPTLPTALSQSCHCGRKAKKKLSTRWHSCECGVRAQRDLYSAFLARHVKNDGENWYLDIESASLEWPRMEPLLKEAVKKVKMCYPYGAPSSFGI
jgi:hypothetical protein